MKKAPGEPPSDARPMPVRWWTAVASHQFERQKQEERNPSLIASGNFLFRIDRFFDEFTIKIDDFFEKDDFSKFLKFHIFFDFFEKMRFERNNVQIIFLSIKTLKNNTNDSE